MPGMPASFMLVPPTAASLGARIVDAVEDAIVVLFQLGMYAAAVGALLLAVRALRRHLQKPQEGAVIAVHDLTSEGEIADARSRALTEHVLADLRFTAGGFGVEDVDESEDLDGSASLNLRAVHGERDRDGLLKADIPITIGVVSTTLRPLLEYWRGISARPPRVSIKGSLASDEPEVLLVLEARRYGDQALPPRVEVRKRGDDRRSEAVRDAAAWIAVELAHDGEAATGTSDWHSLREYRAALGCLQREASRPPNRVELLERARDLLQSSLSYDPGNLLARFYLTVHRKLGQNAAAIGQLEELERATEAGLSRVERFLDRRPDFTKVVRYNLAVVLAKLDDWAAHGRGVALLDELLRQVPPPLGSQSRDAAASESGQDERRLGLRLGLLAVSARASALTFRLHHGAGRARGGGERLAAYRKTQSDDIIAMVERLDALAPDDADAERRTEVYARAVAQTARGRAKAEMGDRRAAVADYRRAITLAPDFVEAYLQLAELYLRAGGGGFPDWVEQAEAALTTALAISPSNPRAHNLLGRLYARDAVARYQDAIGHLKQADSYASSFTEHARLLEKRGDLAGAVAVHRRSVARFPRPDYRFRLFAEAVVKLAAEGRATPDDVAAARRAISKLRRKSKHEADRNAATDLLQALDRIAPPAAPRP
jgi:tetratricopeptide (TPR) repeat protein